MEGLRSALQLSRDETATVVDDIMDMAAQASRDAERIARLEAALRDAQVLHLPWPPSLIKQQRLKRSHGCDIGSVDCHLVRKMTLGTRLAKGRARMRATGFAYAF